VHVVECPRHDSVEEARFDHRSDRSDPFRKLATTQARVLGVPDLPLVMIRHPLGGLSIEQVEGRVLVALPQVVKLIKDRLQ
jgi:hypothetical protein